ncbi:MAG: SDR family oxidoreductase [Nitrospira sp.]
MGDGSESRDVFCCREAFRHMKQRGGGVIINMSSVAGLQAWAGTGTYSAAKHGIMALTKSLTDEGRPYHIKVSAICPGGVADELVDASPAEIERSEKIDPFDVAEAAVYLSTLGRTPWSTNLSSIGWVRIGRGHGTGTAFLADQVRFVSNRGS